MPGQGNYRKLVAKFRVECLAAGCDSAGGQDSL